MTDQPRTFTVTVHDRPDLLERLAAMLRREPGVLRVLGADPRPYQTPVQSFRAQADGAGEEHLV